MSIIVDTTADIPDAPYYVVMTDTMMSGWGQADGVDAVYVAVAHSPEEAEVVVANARGRGDQSRVRINTTKPRPRAGWLLMVMTPDTSAAWYRPGTWGDPPPGITRVADGKGGWVYSTEHGPAHDCHENAVPYESDGPLGHGWECGVCGAFLQAG